MKELIAGVVLIIVVGLGGFLYRNILERNAVPQPEVACTLEAKVCPDGTAVGRSGPNCAFAVCAPPNIEVAELGVGFVLPQGYTQVEAGAAGQEIQRIYTKAGSDEFSGHTITIKRFEIPEGSTAVEVLLSRVRRQPSDLPPESMSDFGTEVIGSHTFRTLGIERFEGHVETAYYLAREKDIIVFDVLERGVYEWTDPALEVSELPEHSALVSMLQTLQSY